MSKNRKFIHKMMVSRLWLFVFLIIVILLVIHSTSLFIKREKVWKKVNQLEKDKKDLEIRKESIDSKNQSLEDGIGKEAILRDKYNVVRPGEDVIVLTEAKVDTTAIPENKGIWSKIRHFLHLDK